MNNKEGFLRQIIWREFCRFTYTFYYKEMIKSNHFSNKNKLTKAHYDGTTKFDHVNDTIKKAFDLGYLHHIERLMIMCNYFNLSEIKPYEIYKWFMEFSIDSYDWVMIFNIYCMGTYACTKFSSKPYISSMNYIMKMSNDYKNNEEFNELYRKFIKKHKITFYY